MANAKRPVNKMIIKVLYYLILEIKKKLNMQLQQYTLKMNKKLATVLFL